MFRLRFYLDSLKQYARSKLEALSAGIAYFLLFDLIIVGPLITGYVLFFTKYWYIAALYLIWIWIIDVKTPHRKGRVNEWVRSWALFKYTTNYFPITVDAVPGAEVDLKRNYLVCCFPHGVMPTGVLMAFQTNALDIKTRLHHKTYGVALNGLLNVPIYRDFMLALGICNSNASTIENILSDPAGGNSIGIMIGGGAEMFHYESGIYKVVLKNRKGFIKIALKTGSPLIPVFAFGENSIFKQKRFPEGSFGRRVQEWTKTLIGFPIVLFYGRGLFQEKFGIIPLKSPINVIVGKPMEVVRIENPTQDDIDVYHEKFIDQLVTLFEKYKHVYEPNPEESKLIIC